MLKTVSLFPSNNFSKEMVIEALDKTGAESTSNYWIVSFPPGRYVRFYISEINDSDFEPKQLDSISKKLGGLNKFYLWIEFSSAEKQGRLGASLIEHLLDVIEGGLVVDESGKIYDSEKIRDLVMNGKGFYE
ncbi:MAG: hypothetical protein ACJ77K_00815 [Bacteroidia bacterium]